MIEFLRSKIATLCVLVLALVAQLPHAAEVFMQAGALRQAQGLQWWLGALHGGAYAMALELAVLLFVVQGHRAASYAFAGVSVLVNLAYYAERVELFSVHGLSAWLISIALPVAIALYSHAVADAPDSAMAFDVRAWWAKLSVPSGATLHPDQDGVFIEYPSVHPANRIVQSTVHNESVSVQGVCMDDCTMVDESPDPRALAVQLAGEGLTRAQISERLGVHRNTVGKWVKEGVYTRMAITPITPSNSAPWLNRPSGDLRKPATRR